MPDDYDDDGQQQTQLSVEDLRALRQAKKERDDLTVELNAQKRELAFAKSGINMDDPQTKYFIKGYDGDLTPEAIRSQAEADGFFQQRRVDTSHEVAGQQRIAQAAAGGSNSGPDLADRIKNAQSQEEVMAIMIEAGYPTSWNSQ